MGKYVMALDAGTTSNRCILFDREGTMVSVAQKEFTQYFPKPGWVEHDAGEIWSTMLGVAVEAMQKARSRGGRYRSHRHHQPERNDHRLGQKYRGTGLSCHCLAVPENAPSIVIP